MCTMPTLTDNSLKSPVFQSLTKKVDEEKMITEYKGYFGDDASEIKTVEENASLNVKRAAILPEKDLQKSGAHGPYHILKTQEIKTTWHPMGI